MPDFKNIQILSLWENTGQRKTVFWHLSGSHFETPLGYFLFISNFNHFLFEYESNISSNLYFWFADFISIYQLSFYVVTLCTWLVLSNVNVAIFMSCSYSFSFYFTKRNLLCCTFVVLIFTLTV